MNAIEDLRYLRARAVQEQRAAEVAQGGTARSCHERLAAQYEARAMQLAIGLHLGGCVDAGLLSKRAEAFRTSAERSVQ